MTASTFRHQPLNRDEASIRLLKVLPRTVSGIIQCELQHATVKSSYVCLSYLWGASNVQHKILVNGQVFYVGANLMDFLLIAQKKYPLMPLWIDAICIDQTSISERNHQVAHMGQIYSRAMKVYAFLGWSPLMIAFIGKWVQRVRTANSKIVSGNLSDILPPSARGFRNVQELRSGCEDLVQNEYWTRAWITQEIALAKQLILLTGHYEIDAKALAGFLKKTFVSRPLWYLPFWNYMHIIKVGHNPTRTRLISLVSRLSGRECRIPRDKVYSILSLISEGSNIMVDYGSSDSVFFERVVRASKASMCICSANVIAHDLGQLSLEPNTCQIKMKLETEVKPYSIVKAESHPGYTCTGCNRFMPSDWQADKGHLACLWQLCRAVQGHLYLSNGNGTLSFTEGGVNNGIKAQKPVEVLGNDIELRPCSTGQEGGFILTFEVLGAFCKRFNESKGLLFHNKQLCMNAQGGTSRFKVLSTLCNTSWDSKPTDATLRSPQWMTSLSTSREWGVRDLSSLDTVMDSSF